MSLGMAFYRGADACVLVYDITVEKTLRQLATWREEFLVQAGPPDPDNFPFVVLGNKVDMEDKRRVTKQMANEFCNARHNIQFFETSAKEAIGVENAFKQIAIIALSRDAEDETDSYAPATVNLGPAAGGANAGGGGGGGCGC